MTRKYLKNDNISAMYKTSIIYLYIYIFIYFLSSIPTKIYQRSSYWSIWGTRSPTCFWKWFKYPSAVNVKTQKKKEKKERHVNKFKKYNPTKVLCSSCVPFWNTAECEEVSHFNQLLQWISVCSMVDRRRLSNEEFPKSFIFSLSSTCVQRFRHISMTTDVGHRQNRRALFFFFFSKRSNPGTNPLVELRGEGHSLDSGGDSGFSSLLVCQEFVSQLNSTSTQLSTNLTTYIQYINYNHKQERCGSIILKYKKCLLASIRGLAVVCLWHLRRKIRSWDMHWWASESEW